MIAIRYFVCALLQNQRGATAIEYGLIVSLIVIAMMGALGGLGGGVGGMWTNVSADVTSKL